MIFGRLRLADSERSPRSSSNVTSSTRTDRGSPVELAGAWQACWSSRRRSFSSLRFLPQRPWWPATALGKTIGPAGPWSHAASAAAARAPPKHPRRAARHTNLRPPSAMRSSHHLIATAPTMCRLAPAPIPDRASRALKSPRSTTWELSSVPPLDLIRAQQPDPHTPAGSASGTCRAFGPMDQPTVAPTADPPSRSRRRQDRARERRYDHDDGRRPGHRSA